MGWAIEGGTFLYRYGSGLKLEGRVAPGSRMELKAPTDLSPGKSGVEQAMIVEKRPNPFSSRGLQRLGSPPAKPLISMPCRGRRMTFDMLNGRQGAYDKAIPEELRS